MFKFKIFQSSLFMFRSVLRALIPFSVGYYMLYLDASNQTVYE